MNILNFLRFEAFTEVTMKNVVFWDVELCRCCVNTTQGQHTGQPTQRHIPEDDILHFKFCSQLLIINNSAELIPTLFGM
jgi:hypothetical protein